MTASQKGGLCLKPKAHLKKHRNRHAARICRTDNFFIGRQILDRENASARRANPAFSPYYFGARYLDPKYSRWMSADPAVGDYIPADSESAKKLPAGGVYTLNNLSLYHYSNNNPIKYVDPDGEFSFSYNEFMKAQLEGCGNTISAAVGDFAGKVGNFFSNVFSGKGDVQPILNAKFDGNLNIGDFSFEGSFDLNIAEASNGLTFETGEGDYKTLRSALEATGSPVKTEKGGFSANIKGVNIKVQSDGDKANVTITGGKKFGLAKGKNGSLNVNITAGISATASTQDGPFGTIDNRKSESLNKKVDQAEYARSPQCVIDNLED